MIRVRFQFVSICINLRISSNHQIDKQLQCCMTKEACQENQSEQIHILLNVIAGLARSCLFHLRYIDFHLSC